jgi:hypothetical protein
MKTNLNSKIWDFVPVVGFFILTITEGKTYWLAGILTIAWLAVVAFRYYIKE